jgi:oligopeptide/dipeptide ABC transporter ATP-binding protein
MSVLLRVKHLQTYFYTESGTARAVDGVSFAVSRRETLCIVGESGCGKSVTALSIMRLIPEPPGKIVGGEIMLDGIDLLKLSEREMRGIRGNRIAMIFQEPMTSLNPVFTCGSQIQEAVELHQRLRKGDARDRTIETLRLVGISAPEQRYNEYPHQLSGGMRQRVMIAMALSCEPQLLIADEPTTALDVTVQAQILGLLAQLRNELGMGVIVITHNLGVVAEVADRIAVMYAGKIVEYAAKDQLFHSARHPYTIGLLRSVPRLHEESERLEAVPGAVPFATQYPQGCRFSTRCAFADDQCRKEEPPLEEMDVGHNVACWKMREVVTQMNLT